MKCLVATGMASQSNSTGLGGVLGSGVNFWMAIGTSLGTYASLGGSYGVKWETAIGVSAHLFLSSGDMVARDSLTVGGMNTSHSAVVKELERIYHQVM